MLVQPKIKPIEYELQKTNERERKNKERDNFFFTASNLHTLILSDIDRKERETDRQTYRQTDIWKNISSNSAKIIANDAKNKNWIVR